MNKKRLIYNLLLLLMLLCFGNVVNAATKDYAIYGSDIDYYVNKIGNTTIEGYFHDLLSEYTSGDVTTTSTTTNYWTNKINENIKSGNTRCGGAWQCFGFSLYSYAKMFGCLGTDVDTTNNYLLLKNASSVSYNSFVNAGVKSGAHIRCVSSANNGHSLIVLYYDESNIVVYHANGDGKGTVYVGKYTWSQFNSTQLSGHGGSDGARYVRYVAMPKEYPQSNNYVDVGTNFYAYIINAGPWKHIGVEADGNVRLQGADNTVEQKWYFERQSDKSYKITNVKTGKILEDCNFGGSGSNVQTLGSNDSSAQRWFISGVGGAYHLHPACAVDCSLDIADGSTERGANVQVYTTNDSGAQKFSIYQIEKPSLKTVVPTASFRDEKRNVHLSWAIAENADGYDIRIYRGNSEEVVASAWNFKENWYDISLQPGSYEVSVATLNTAFNDYIISDRFAFEVPYVDLGTNFYAFIVNNNTEINSWKHIGVEADGNVKLQGQDNTAEQKWFFERQSDRSYKITNVKTGKILDDCDFGGSGSNVGTMGSNDSTAQRWFISGYGGYFHLHPACALSCSLDIKGGSGEVGSNVQVYTTNESGAQDFSIYKIEKPELKVVIPAITYGDANKNIHITWEPAENADAYDVRLYRTGEETEFLFEGVIRQNWYDVALEPGRYEVSIATLNTSFNDYIIGDKYEFAAYSTEQIGSPLYEAVYNGHKYMLFGENVSWDFAEAYCESIGGTLAVITSDEENEIVKGLAQRYGDWVSIGANDLKVEGQFEWVTGEPFEYSNWYPGQPNNAGNYLQMIVKRDGVDTFDSSHNGEWDEWNENESWYSWYSRAFVCEIDLEIPSIKLEKEGGILIGAVIHPEKISSVGIVYLRGTEEVTLDTLGRTRIVFTELSSDGTFTFDAAGLSGYMFRAYVIYKDQEGNEVIAYSDSLAI